jgi:hypothetical protein
VTYQGDVSWHKATVMRFDGTNWLNVGNVGFSVGEAGNPRLAFSPSGQPYVAYSDAANSSKATVMKYDSAFVGINEPQESRLSIFPNPATVRIMVEKLSSNKECNLVLVNLTGQELITRRLTEPKTVIDISTLPSGVYFVRLTNDKTVEVGKIIKQ